MRPYLLAGPRLGILTSAKGRVEFVDGTVETEDIKDVTKGLDLGVAFGAGVGLGVGKNTHAFVEGIYALPHGSGTEDGLAAPAVPSWLCGHCQADRVKL